MKARNALLFFIGFLFSASAIHAQDNIEGVVKDALNGSPIPYAKIWFIENGAVFSCSGNGTYCLVLPKNMRKQKVIIECYGYASDTIVARQLVKNSTIELSPLPRELRVVNIRPQPTPISILAEAYAKVAQNFHADTTIGVYQDFQFATMDGMAYLKQDAISKLIHFGYDDSRMPKEQRDKLVKKFLRGYPVKDYIEKEYRCVEVSPYWADTLSLRKRLAGRGYWPIVAIDETMKLRISNPVNPLNANWVARYALFVHHDSCVMELRTREDSSKYYTIYVYDHIRDYYYDTTEYHVEYPSMAISYGETRYKWTMTKFAQKRGFADGEYYDTIVENAAIYVTFSEVDDKYGLDSVGYRLKRSCQVKDKRYGRRFYPSLMGQTHHYDIYYKRKRLDLHRKTAEETLDSILPPRTYTPTELQPWMREAMQ